MMIANNKNLLQAKQEVLTQLDNLNLVNSMYQGTIDITEHVDFQTIGTEFDLTIGQYECLIKDTEKLVKQAVKFFYNHNVTFMAGIDITTWSILKFLEKSKSYQLKTPGVLNT